VNTIRLQRLRVTEEKHSMQQMWKGSCTCHNSGVDHEHDDNKLH